MTDAPIHRFGLDEFIVAWEAGAFHQHVELVNGEVWRVRRGRWNGATTARLYRMIPPGDHELTASSLPAGDSLPDPDAWVLRRAAVEAEALCSRISRWAPEDVLLVVEVSDETEAQDLGTKAALYAGAGFATYWVVTTDGVWVHTDPGRAGYRSRVLHIRGQVVAVPYLADATVDVTDLIGPPE